MAKKVKIFKILDLTWFFGHNFVANCPNSFYYSSFDSLYPGESNGI